MSRLWLHAFAVTLALCAAAAAQGTSLVRQDDRDDPCRRFRMRDLVPVDVAPEGLRARRPAVDVDPGMVRDPCRPDEPQFALAPVVPSPNRWDEFFSPPSNNSESPVEAGRWRARPGAFLSKPSPVFEMMRRRRRQ